MQRLHLRSVLFLCSLLPVSGFALAQSASAPVGNAAAGKLNQKTPPAPMNGATALTRFGELPADFAGAAREGSATNNGTPELADSTHPAVLKEAGFVSSSIAHYEGSGGSAKWTVEILRFGDATGAYSVYTFYRQPDMTKQSVGDNAAANASTFLVRSSATVIRIQREGGVAPPPGDLLSVVRTLVTGLPKLHGPDAIPPSLPSYLPAPGLDDRTIHYAIGPAAYNGPIPAQLLGFEQEAEVITAHYRLHGTDATTTLLMYPTPQLAIAAQRRIAGTDASLHTAMRQMGPVLAVISGAGLSAPEATAFLQNIHYTADVTVNHPEGYVSEVAKTAKLLLGIAYLTGALAVAAITVALLLGGGRVLYRKMRGLPESSLNDEQFIRLKINE